MIREASMGLHARVRPKKMLLVNTQADGGSLVGDKQYIGFDLRNAPLTVLYSKSSGTTVAPITSDENIADFYPIIEIMRKDIYDELPQCFVSCTRHTHATCALY